MATQNDIIGTYVSQLELGNRRSLSVRLDGYFSIEDGKRLASAIRAFAPELESLSIAVSIAEAGSIEALLNPLHGNTSFKELTCDGFWMQETDSKAVAKFLQSGVKLSELHLKRLALNDHRLIPIFEALTHQPQMEGLGLHENRHGLEGMTALMPALKKMRSLTKFFFNNMNLDPDSRDLIEETLSINTHPNLLTCSISLHDNLTGNNARQLRRILGEMAGNQFESYALHEFQHIEQRLTGLNSIAEDSDHLSDGLVKYEQYIIDLPKPPKDRPATLDDLLAPDERNLTALDNPQLWKQNPNLLGELAANGQLSATSLQEVTPRGRSVLEYIAAFAPPEQAVRVLADNGTPLRSSLLLNEKNQPTPVFTFLRNQHELTPVFQEGNWIGGSSRDLKRLLGALTDAERAELPNSHGLVLAVSRSERQSHGEMRA